MWTSQSTVSFVDSAKKDYSLLRSRSHLIDGNDNSGLYRCSKGNITLCLDCAVFSISSFSWRLIRGCSSGEVKPRKYRGIIQSTPMEPGAPKCNIIKPVLSLQLVPSWTSFIEWPIGFIWSLKLLKTTNRTNRMPQAIHQGTVVHKETQSRRKLSWTQNWNLQNEGYENTV